MDKYFKIGLVAGTVFGSIMHMIAGAGDNVSKEMANWGWNITLLLSLLVLNTLPKEK